MQYIGSLEAAEEHISAKICMDLQDSVQRSLQNPAETILQICTDSQRLKTWVVAVLLVQRTIGGLVDKAATAYEIRHISASVWPLDRNNDSQPLQYISKVSSRGLRLTNFGKKRMSTETWTRTRFSDDKAI